MTENHNFTFAQKLKALEIAVAIHGPIAATADADYAEQHFRRYNDTASWVIKTADQLPTPDGGITPERLAYLAKTFDEHKGK